MREDACGHGACRNLCLLRTDQRRVCLAAGASASSAEQTVRPQSTAERPAAGPVSVPASQTRQSGQLTGSALTVGAWRDRLGFRCWTQTTTWPRAGLRNALLLPPTPTLSGIQISTQSAMAPEPKETGGHARSACGLQLPCWSGDGGLYAALQGDGLDAVTIETAATSIVHHPVMKGGGGC